MKLLFATVLTYFVALNAKKLNKVPRHDTPDISISEESDLLSEEEQNDLKPPFDFKGTLKRSFAIEAVYTDLSKNVVCSPLSAMFPLGKLILGTVKGKSRTELQNALGFNHTSAKRKIKSLLNDIIYLPGVSITLASRLFVNKSMDISKKYLEDVKSTFQSTLEKINFKNAVESASKINKWVKTYTVGMITSMVSPSDISPDTSILLLNAVYFKGYWKRPFYHVFVGDFHSPLGIRKVPMMRKKAHYNYVLSEILNAKIIEIPYQGEKASMVIVLPISKTGLQILLSTLKLAPELLNQEMAKMSRREVTITMPKFKIQTEINLKELYTKLGIRAIFTEDSGLSRISHVTPVVTGASQTAYIEVTEQGSKVAASSKIDVEAISYQYEKISFVAEHPFLFHIKLAHQQLVTGIFNHV